MPARWSKLRKQVEDLFVPKLGLKLQCTAIRQTWQNEGSLAEVLGVFTVRLGKNTIWKFPSQFVDYQTVYPDGKNHYSYGVADINKTLRDYLNTPKEELLGKVFDRDFFGITNILKAADRRLALSKLKEYFQNPEPRWIHQILETRERVKGT